MEFLENRELSWLKFNKRVLEEAMDKNVPLLDRLSFSAIYQSNLDEFFMVRVGSITDEAKLHKNMQDSKTKMTPAQQLDAIFTKVRRLQPMTEEAYRKTMEELAPYGFEHVSFETATQEELTFLELYFRREIKPFISGIIVNRSLPFPFLKNKEIYAAVQIQAKKDVVIGIVPIKHDHNERVIPLGAGGKRFILEEEVVLHFVHLLFKGYKVIDRTLLRVTRNADIMVSGKGSDFRERMEELVAKRKKLAPVRLEISDEFSRSALDYICKKLKLKNERVFVSRIPLDLSYLYSLADLSELPELKFAPRTPQKTTALSESRSVFAQIKSKDVLLSYPYESIDSSFIRLLRESASDPKVTSIKITLYRLARSSKVIDALCTAADNGKEVLVMIELRARFDEANNIEWSKILQQAGCKVIYGPGDYKAHSKLLLITRKAPGGAFDYITQIGTGNYNEKTARLYTDLSLLTSNREIAEDAAKVFDSLQSGTFVEETKQLLVAPLCLRDPVLELMDEQIRIARDGGNGYIAAKINSLTDKTVIMKLVEASQAGVKVELVIRGICCLIAGVKGYTENITVRSIVGRFLEHSRIYIFGEDNDERRIYISSADYMTRNTVNRVEVAAPVLDKKLKKRISDMFRIFMTDNVKARIMQSDGNYIHAEPAEGEAPLNAQEYFYDEAYKKAADKKVRQDRMKENRAKGAAKKSAKKNTAKKTSSGKRRKV
ncbi:MAG: polyphosphate kinase 1 [Ruminococcus sp.]|nr:polyphosphate kinase 1 [Ruminococcus sp.]